MKRVLPEHQAVISGVGQSRIGRTLELSSFRLTIDAIFAAVADAGLRVDDIDGLATILVPNDVMGPPGEDIPECAEVLDALGIRANWVLQAFTHFPLGHAVRAVAHGECRHAVVFNTVKEGSAWNHQTRKIRPTAAKGQAAWLLPVGAFATANIFALYAKRYMHEYGLTREQLGWIPVVQRAHAVRNPDAIYQEPLRIEDYLQARMISEPFCLYDCDPPVDASTAFVVSAIDTVPDLRSPVHIEAMAMISASRASFDLSGDLTRMAAHDAATELWSRTDLTPQDIDVAQLYDGHSFFALMWLEALGLCNRGEAGDFVEGGKRITYGGDIPINTWGGHLSGGRLHAGFGHLAEAVRQVRGEADLRQVRDVETAAITVGAGPAAACALLSRRAAE